MTRRRHDIRKFLARLCHGLNRRSAHCNANLPSGASLWTRAAAAIRNSQALGRFAQRRGLVALALTTILVASAAMPARAQIFGGIVYDPTNYGNAVLRYQQLQQQLTQLITTYQQIRTQYQLLLKQSQRLPLGLAARYLGIRTPWRPLVSSTTYGTTANWLDAANTGHDALAAFTKATETLNNYGADALRILSAAEQLRVRERHDRARLQDGVVTTALEAIGRLRFHEGSVETTLRNLESDTYSDDNDLHTQVAVLNKINAADVAAARIAKDTNYLLVSLLEQQMLDATERREATVQALNAHQAFLLDARPLLAASTGETTAALTSFRIPGQ